MNFDRQVPPSLIEDHHKQTMAKEGYTILETLARRHNVRFEAVGGRRAAFSQLHFPGLEA